MNESVNPLDPRLAVVNVARSMTWVREVGTNRGQSVEAILKSVYLAPGAPWCAAFVNYVGKAVCDRVWPLPMVGGCVTLADAAREMMKLGNEPVTGSIFLLWSDRHNRFNHTGFIAKKRTANEWGTVEGNTSPGGSPEGTGVFERVRTFGASDRFIYWWI